MSLAHFRTLAELDPRGRPIVATVTVDRARQLVMVRPLRRRRTYDLPLGVLAEFVYQSVIKAERAEKVKARKARRKSK